MRNNRPTPSQLIDDALTRLEDSLRAGRSGQLEAYLALCARFHRYSFGNVLLIATQCPRATHVADFHAWKKLGRWVRKGEHGIAIIAPQPIKARRQQASESDEPDVQMRFKTVHVFDVTQTEGEPLPERPRYTGTPGEALHRLAAFAASRSIEIEIAPIVGGALGYSTGGRIVLDPAVTGDEAEHFAVLAHELAHELLHQRQDDRPASKKVRETEAEAVAAAVSEAIGLNATTSAADYLSLYDGDADTLRASLDRIHATATTVLAELLIEAPGDAAK